MARIERIAFVCPRLAKGSTVGGAETLLRELAVRAAENGCHVTFLATCATDHFTWKNALPPGRSEWRGMQVHLFPVDEDRDHGAFLEAQRSISRGAPLRDGDEETWLRHGAVSRDLANYLREHQGDYDRIVAGPYLFGLVVQVCRIRPDKTFLVPCLHDEPFARVPAIGDMFRSVRGILFNTEPERDLAVRIYEALPASAVVGIGIPAFQADGDRFRQKHGLAAPYILYSGRREELKGTPLLLDYFAAFRLRTGKRMDLVLTGSGPVEVPAAVAAHVHDVGFISEADKRDAMAGALAFCHPSVYESLGIVILEAWMAGTPALVHSRSTVLRFHCRRSGGGLWFRAYPDFEEILLRFLNDPVLVGRLGECGKAYVSREYGWETVSARLFEALAR